MAFPGSIEHLRPNRFESSIPSVTAVISIVPRSQQLANIPYFLYHVSMSDPDIPQLFEELSSLFENTGAVYIPELHQSFDWKDRLRFSHTLGLGHAAPGGRYSQALFEAVYRGRVSGVREALFGEVVVELGAGCTHWGSFLAEIAGAKAYIAIEAFYSDVLRHNISHCQIPHMVLETDMLSALQKLPDSTFSFIACGIEDCILPGPRYKSLVEDEIRRLLSPSGALVCSQSDLRLPDKKKVLFRFQRERSKVKDEGCVYFNL